MLNKINLKLINICVFVLTILLVYKSSEIWIKIINIFSKIFLPFFLAFLFSYAISPIIKFFEKKGLPKALSVCLVILIIFIILVIIIGLLIPLLFSQMTNFFGEIVIFLKNISIKFNIDISFLEKMLVDTFNNTLKNMPEYITNISINIVNVLTKYFSLIVIFISSSIYFLFDMDNIRKAFKSLLVNKRIYALFKKIDEELKKYFKSFFVIMFITLFEYGFLFFVIGHPNFLLLGLLASLASFIPCFGGILVNILAAITAFVISTKLFVRTLILFCILSLIDGYVINPLIYGKSNKVPPIITIFAVFACTTLLKTLGIIIALPLTIVILTIYRFFKNDICDKIKKGMKKYKEV